MSVSSSWGIGDIVSATIVNVFGGEALTSEQITDANGLLGVEVTSNFRLQRCGSNAHALAMAGFENQPILEAFEAGPHAELLTIAGRNLTSVSIAAAVGDRDTAKLLAYLNRADLAPQDLVHTFGVDSEVASALIAKRRTSAFTTLEDVDRVAGVSQSTIETLLAKAKKGKVTKAAERKDKARKQDADGADKPNQPDASEPDTAGPSNELSVIVTGRELTAAQKEDALSDSPSAGLVTSPEGTCYMHTSTSVDTNAISSGSVKANINLPTFSGDVSIRFSLAARLVGGDGNLGGRIGCPEIFCNYDWVEGKVRLEGTWNFSFSAEVGPQQLAAMGLRPGVGATATMEWGYNIFRFRHFPTFAIRY